MADYRNRPHVDTPPPTVRQALDALGLWEALKLAALIATGAAGGALWAVAGGYLWR